MIILFYKILNYKNNKERFQEKAQDKYKELFFIYFSIVFYEQYFFTLHRGSVILFIFLI